MLMRFLLVWLFAGMLNAAQFTATVRTNNVSAGERVILNLILNGAKASESPDLSALIRDFTIYNQQQYSTYSNNNGTVTSDSGWDITLLPKVDGNVIIPSLEVKTNKGILRSETININISSEINDAGNNKNNLGVSLIATTNKDHAYVKEPILYTLKIISHKPIVNVMLEDIKASDAIVDKAGEPKQYEQVLDGLRAHVIEVKYYITPLVSGNIKISPAHINGEVQEVLQQQTHRNHRFGRLNNFFMDNTVDFKPFSLNSNDIVIKSISPPIKSSDWLPLSDLRLSEQWVGVDNAKVGDAITRKINIKSEGGFSNQLPSVKKFLDVEGIKVYADKPILTDDVVRDIKISTKEESYSLVPLQDGEIFFPEIKISWWNLKSNKLESSVLPAKRFNIYPSAIISSENSTVDYSSETLSGVSVVNDKPSVFIYSLVISLVVVICSMFAVIVYLLRNKHVSANKKITNKKINVEAKKISIITVDDLKLEIISYACKNWRMPISIVLNKLGVFLTSNNYGYNLDVYMRLSKNINAALYASSQVELPMLLELWEEFKLSVVKVKGRKEKQHKPRYINLNPT